MSINVEMSAPYLSLDHLVSAMAQAVLVANRSAKELQNPEETLAAAALTWESKLRELAEARAIKGHDWDSLAAQDWVYLNIERDVFFVDDLNGCRELTAVGFKFEVVENERDEEEFATAFAESTNNGTLISWRYWIEQMPSLSAGEAARLMAGLDPDLYADLNARPVPRNNVADVCKKALALERLALREGKERDTSLGWMTWAQERHLKVHGGFLLAVEDKRQLDEAVASLSKLPPKEQAYWETALQGEQGRRQVTFNFAGFMSTALFSLPQFIGEVQDRLERWRLGEYFLVEVAQVLHDANRAHGAERLCRQMETAIHNGKLKLRENGVQLERDDLPRGRLWNRMVRADDVNDWLADAKAGYALRYPYALFEQIQAGDDRYRAPMHAKLTPVTPWTGARMAHEDILSIADAAAFATKHAGHEVTVRDFLRAGARDEIPIRVICPRTVTLLPTRDGDVVFPMPARSYPNLPPEACKVLGIHGKAAWRTHEYAEARPEFGGEVCYYTRWRLPDAEPDLECTVNDCLVVGHDVHALADAFLIPAKPDVPSPQVEPAPAPALGPLPTSRDEEPKGETVAKVKEAAASAPVFSMPRAALVAAHEHRWPTIRRDMQDASSNGLSAAKAGPREWYESVALEWARAKGKLKDQGEPLASDINQVMRTMAATLPVKKHRIQG